MEILKISALGVAGVLLAIQFRNSQNEYSLYITIAISLCIFWEMKEYLETMVTFVQDMIRKINIDARYFDGFMKILGVAYLSEFSSSLCKDAGYQTVADQIEVFSKIAIFVLSLPVLQALLDTIQLFLA